MVKNPCKSYAITIEQVSIQVQWQSSTESEHQRWSMCSFN